jgi:hypothetical protein
LAAWSTVNVGATVVGLAIALDAVGEPQIGHALCVEGKAILGRLDALTDQDPCDLFVGMPRREIP